MVYVFIAIVPAYCVARIVRGVYMYKYAWDVPNPGRCAVSLAAADAPP